MAGRSNKGRNRRGPQNLTTSLDCSSDTSLKDNVASSKKKPPDVGLTASSQPKQGDHLYPVPVKIESGVKVELQALNWTNNISHLWDLCCSEIAVHSAMHILKDVLRDMEDHDLGPAIAHLLSCFFGSCKSVADGLISSTESKDQKKEQSSSESSINTSMGHSRCRKNVSSYMNISSQTLWSKIHRFAKLKYKFELPEDARLRVKKTCVLRKVCQETGINVADRKYDFNAAIPFLAPDILNLHPVVKEMMQLIEVTGPMHQKDANWCWYLGDMAGAIMQQEKEIIINGRRLGLDHPDTAHSMNVFYEGLKQTELALQHMHRKLLLLGLSSGPDHPDVAATFINAAMVHNDIGNNTALPCPQEAKVKNERLHCPDPIQAAEPTNGRCMGLDHPDTAHSMDVFYKDLKQTELALQHMHRKLLLLGLYSGRDHPDVAATFINAAMMHHYIGNNTTLPCPQEAKMNSQEPTNAVDSDARDLKSGWWSRGGKLDKRK